MFKNIDNYRSNRWGQDNEQEFYSIDLLSRKDQQIRKLQAELDQERKRADNANQLLENFKGSRSQSEQSSEGLRSQITRRIKAEDQLKKLQRKNEKLQETLQLLLKRMEQQKQTKQMDSIAEEMEI